jgi:hypothetical protein
MRRRLRWCWVGAPFLLRSRMHTRKHAHSHACALARMRTRTHAHSHACVSCRVPYYMHQMLCDIVSVCVYVCRLRRGSGASVRACSYGTVCACGRGCVCGCVCVSVSLFVCLCLCLCLCLYIYRYMYQYIYYKLWGVRSV